MKRRYLGLCGTSRKGFRGHHKPEVHCHCRGAQLAFCVSQAAAVTVSARIILEGHLIDDAQKLQQ